MPSTLEFTIFNQFCFNIVSNATLYHCCGRVLWKLKNFLQSWFRFFLEYPVLVTTFRCPFSISFRKDCYKLIQGCYNTISSFAFASLSHQNLRISPTYHWSTVGFKFWGSRLILNFRWSGNPNSAVSCSVVTPHGASVAFLSLCIVAGFFRLY